MGNEKRWDIVWQQGCWPKFGIAKPLFLPFDPLHRHNSAWIFESESTTLCAIFSDREHSPLVKLYGRLSLVSLVSFFDLPCRFHPLILSSFWPSNCTFWPPFDCLYSPEVSVYSLPQLPLCLRFHILSASFLHPRVDSFRSARRTEKHLSFYLHGTPTTRRTSAWSFSM